MSTASKSSELESETAILTTHPSSPMCERSPDCPTVAAWISSLPASRVSRSPLRGRSEARTTSGICGRIPFAFFVRFALGGRSWRTCRDYSGDTATTARYSESWPKRGFMSGGIAYPLKSVEPRTDASAYGCLFPTPSATSYGTNLGGGSGRVGKVRMSLETMARKAEWPTPGARDGKNARWTDYDKAWAACAKRDSPDLGLLVSSMDGGRLNPRWVEWLMGWPIGWCSLEPLETDKFRAWWSKQCAR